MKEFREIAGRVSGSLDITQVSEDDMMRVSQYIQRSNVELTRLLLQQHQKANIHSLYLQDLLLPILQSFTEFTRPNKWTDGKSVEKI